MALIHISKDPPSQLSVDFTYDPQLVAKVKTIPGHRCHTTDKIYTHVSKKNLGSIMNPLDNLNLEERDVATI